MPGVAGNMLPVNAPAVRPTKLPFVTGSKIQLLYSS
jgi:hypothetical protein